MTLQVFQHVILSIFCINLCYLDLKKTRSFLSISVWKLQGDILDVNEIFRDLGAMVYEQGEQIDTIEANVEKAHTDVEQGTEQLVKAASYQVSYLIPITLLLPWL